MTSKLAFLLSLTLNALLPTNALRAPQNGTIKWLPCKQNGTLPVTCATLKVPLDYSDPTSNATLDLSLVKVSAVKQPCKGSILFNPGGPGEGGVSFINGAVAEPLLVATGGYHDLIGFDTRGTENTLPFSCYENEIDREIAALRTPATTNTSDASIGTTWAIKKTLARNCYNNARETGELIGTAFVARDMMQIVDALQEDGLLRYWGFSYGTLLGATVAAMFPDRMDKVILDGVLNPDQYYEGRDIEELTDSDATFAGFFSGCLAAPPGSCALARPNITAAALEQEILTLLETLKYTPLVDGSSETTSFIDYGVMKGAIITSLYGPAYWPSLATALQGLLNNNGTALLNFVAAVSSGADLNLIEANAGIRCGDNSLRTNTLAEVLPVVEALYAKSFALGDAEAVVSLTCSSWLLQAKERYQGGFHDIRTKNPLLLIGNTFDPLTPLVSARNASAGFVGSRVLQHDGYGHTSLAQPSLCTAKVIRAYFVDGVLPAEGTKCEPDVPLFSNETITQAFAPIANFERRSLDGGKGRDDVTLFKAVKLLRRESGIRGKMLRV